MSRLSPPRVPRRLAALALLALATTACSSDPTAISVEMATDAVTRDLADKALAEFRRVCAPLFTTHAADVSGLTALVTDERVAAVPGIAAFALNGPLWFGNAN